MTPPCDYFVEIIYHLWYRAVFDMTFIKFMDLCIRVYQHWTKGDWRDIAKQSKYSSFLHTKIYMNTLFLNLYIYVKRAIHKANMEFKNLYSKKQSICKTFPPMSMAAGWYRGFTHVWCTEGEEPNISHGHSSAFSRGQTFVTTKTMKLWPRENDSSAKSQEVRVKFKKWSNWVDICFLIGLRQV